MNVENGDRRDVQWMLVLSTAVCVNGKAGDELNGESELDIKEMQLVITNAADWKRHGPLVGKDVRVTVTLFDAHTAHHRTRVLLTVRLVEAQPGRRKK
jgi:hypothetical protein